MRNPFSTSTALDERGFTVTELIVSTLVTLIVTGAALGTFESSVRVNDSAGQLADANQNLRAGMNQLIRDIMQAGRIIGPEGIPVPTGSGAVAIVRPGPPSSSLSFDLSTTTNIPDITTGHDLGPAVSGETTDIITILTIDPFMPTVTAPAEATIAGDGSNVTFATTAKWMVGDSVDDTPAIQVGDIVLIKAPNGSTMQTVTRKTATQIFFDSGDEFRLNQPTVDQGSIKPLRPPVTNPLTPFNATLFRVLMITYYIDNDTTPGAPRLVRKINNFEPQALAGVVEDLQLRYDVVDGRCNPTKRPSLPFTETCQGETVTYNSNQVRTVTVHAGVRSEELTHPSGDYIRNHITTTVDVRSLASVDNYR